MRLQEELTQFGFQKKGIIKTDEEQTLPKLELLEPDDDLEGSVYLWVTEIDNTPSQIIYVGKAGGKMSKRIKEWNRGFTSHVTAIPISFELLKYLEAGTKISIYVRHSDMIKILGQEHISLCETEEKVLIRLYKGVQPLLNKLDNSLRKKI
ncbi:MAG: hypothetical protein ACR2KZ_08265 [Segetibacter sp.]